VPMGAGAWRSTAAHRELARRAARVAPHRVGRRAAARARSARV